MPRSARIVIPGVAHHVTPARHQDGRVNCGNHRQDVFFVADDRRAYLEILRRHGRTGRPWADPRLLARLEKQLSRRLAPHRPGRPRKPQ